jgi:methylated-DNA-[protein]-cysteine S-methyltransferase
LEEQTLIANKIGGSWELPRLRCPPSELLQLLKICCPKTARQVSGSGSLSRCAFVEVFEENHMKYYSVYDSPVGPLQMVSDGSSLIGLHFSNSKDAANSAGDPTVSPFPETAEQLDRYFAGSLEKFDLPILLNGSDFQVRAWNALRNIPYGETISYKMQAEQIGSMPRAVGLANGQNPVCIVVPCHRVIGADGRLVGYGGGLHRKRALLQFEATVHDFGPQPFSGLLKA